MRFEKEFILRPLISGYSHLTLTKGKPYYEQILWLDEDYPFALVHIDCFWPGKKEINPEEKYIIYDALKNGEQVKIKVTFEKTDNE